MQSKTTSIPLPTFTSELTSTKVTPQPLDIPTLNMGPFISSRDPPTQLSPNQLTLKPHTPIPLTPPHKSAPLDSNLTATTLPTSHNTPRHGSNLEDKVFNEDGSIDSVKTKGATKSTRETSSPSWMKDYYCY